MNWRQAVAAGVMCGFASGAEAQEEVLTEKVLSVDLALQAAQVALGACRVRGAGSIAIVVLDGHGEEKVVLVGDRSVSDALDAAYRKARIALSGRPSSQPAVIRVRPPTRALGRRVQQNAVNADAGGVPVFVGNEMVATIAVAGGTMDEYCANAGLDWITQRLK